MTRTAFLFGLVLSATALAAACSSGDTSHTVNAAAKRTTTDPSTGQALPDYNDPHTTVKEGLPDALSELLKKSSQSSALCARAGTMTDANPNFNAVTSMLCKDAKTLTGIGDLQTALGLGFTTANANGTNGSNGNPGFALLANSTALTARDVSAINPRAFIFSPPPGQPVPIPGFVVMTFVRGEPFIEIAAQSPKAGNKLSFYLLKFELACGASCANGDLLTPATEKNWQSYTVYDDDDLKNTLMDCQHCHQPDGTSGAKILRMQELADPWTHWFRNDRPGGIALLQDFFRAHGNTEDYGGIPAALISKSDGRALEDLVNGNGGSVQPNVFETTTIEAEVNASAGGQPDVNVPKGSSNTWQRIYNRAYAGNFIPVPYHDVKVTDPDKLQYLSDQYKLFQTSGGTLPDIRRSFLDSALEDMLMVSKTGATGADILVSTCAQCHNGKLDQTISRAKFDATNLAAMSRAEKDLAISRLNLSPSDRLKMPPAFMRSLPDDANAAAIAELKK